MRTSGKGKQSKRVDETDNVYGKLTVLSFSRTVARTNKLGGGNSIAIWLCQCECGNTVEVSGPQLRRKDNKATRTCGCHRLKHGHAQGEQSLTYVSWHSMISRCTCPNYNGFVDYGGKGITVCNRWLKFENFLGDMGERPSKNHTIDRKNGSGNYEPGNCQWATKPQQNRNQRTNVWITHNGKTQVLTDWLREIGLHFMTYYTRRKRGKTIKEALGLE